MHGHVSSVHMRESQLMNVTDTAALDYALKILKVAAKRLDLLEGLASAIDQSQMDSTSAEYYMLRVHLVRLGVVFQCVCPLIRLLGLSTGST